MKECECKNIQREIADSANAGEAYTSKMLYHIMDCFKEDFPVIQNAQEKNVYCHCCHICGDVICRD